MSEREGLKTALSRSFVILHTTTSVIFWVYHQVWHILNDFKERVSESMLHYLHSCICAINYAENAKAPKRQNVWKEMWEMQPGGSSGVVISEQVE